MLKKKKSPDFSFKFHTQKNKNVLQVRRRRSGVDTVQEPVQMKLSTDDVLQVGVGRKKKFCLYLLSPKHVPLTTTFVVSADQKKNILGKRLVENPHARCHYAIVSCSAALTDTHTAACQTCNAVSVIYPGSSGARAHTYTQKTKQNKNKRRKRSRYHHVPPTDTSFHSPRTSRVTSRLPAYDPRPSF